MENRGSGTISQKQMPQEDLVLIVSNILESEFRDDGDTLSPKRWKKIRRYSQKVARALKDRAVIYPKSNDEQSK